MAGDDDTSGRIHWGDLRDTDVALLKQIADEAAKRAGHEMLSLMGFDPDNPREAQADMLFLRSSRQRCDGAIGKVIYGVVAVVVGSALGLLWVGFKASLKITLPLMTLAAMVAATFAQEHHDRHHAYYQNWVNKADKGCCNNQDCGELASENERTTPAGIEVKVAGEWCPVQPYHYLKRGNAPDWSTAHVCIQTYDAPSGKACDRLLCYQPKPGS